MIAALIEVGGTSLSAPRAGTFSARHAQARNRA
jgi:hypothetical protein